MSVQRTLVKSPPEIWAEVSDVAALTRHLGEFGEIRITRLEAETTVAWEGETARGTVELSPAGWGTKVTLTAEAVASDGEAVAPEPAEAAEQPTAPLPVIAEASAPRIGRFARWWRRRRAQPVAPEAVAAVVAPEPEPEPVPTSTAIDPGELETVLAGVLDDLGSAHHRPFSRG